MEDTSPSASAVEAKTSTQSPISTEEKTTTAPSTHTNPAASASTATSALQANIAKNGKRSYYYAHTGKVKSAIGCIICVHSYIFRSFVWSLKSHVYVYFSMERVVTRGAREENHKN